MEKFLCEPVEISRSKKNLEQPEQKNLEPVGGNFSLGKNLEREEISRRRISRLEKISCGRSCAPEQKSHAGA